MNMDILESYQQNIHQEINLPGFNSFSRNPTIALPFSFMEKPGCVPVLSVLTCANYNGFAGFHLDKYAYTDNPEQQEVIMTEGVNALVLSVEVDVYIINTTPALIQYYGRKINVIHLFHHK